MKRKRHILTSILSGILLLSNARLTNAALDPFEVMYEGKKVGFEKAQLEEAKKLYDKLQGYRNPLYASYEKVRVSLSKMGIDATNAEALSNILKALCNVVGFDSKLVKDLIRCLPKMKSQDMVKFINLNRNNVLQINQALNDLYDFRDDDDWRNRFDEKYNVWIDSSNWIEMLNTVQYAKTMISGGDTNRIDDIFDVIDKLNCSNETERENSIKALWVVLNIFRYNTETEAYKIFRDSKDLLDKAVDMKKKIKMLTVISLQKYFESEFEKSVVFENFLNSKDLSLGAKAKRAMSEYIKDMKESLKNYEDTYITKKAQKEVPSQKQEKTEIKEGSPDETKKDKKNDKAKSKSGKKIL